MDKIENICLNSSNDGNLNEQKSPLYVNPFLSMQKSLFCTPLALGKGVCTKRKEVSLLIPPQSRAQLTREGRVNSPAGILIPFKNSLSSNENNVYE